jgi:hypothetical protein
VDRQVVRFCIEGSVSRHNDSRDEVDDEQWDFLVSKIRSILVEHEYLMDSLRIEERQW